MLRATISSLLLVAACSGSSSESPWPVPPVDTTPRPAGEARPDSRKLDVSELPSRSGRDAGSDREDEDASAPPNEEEKK